MAETIEDEKPLDPAIEAVRKRLARLMVVSIGIMMVGLFAVMGAIVYKASNASLGTTNNGTLIVPQGLSVVDQSLNGNTIALRLRGSDGRETIMLFSLDDGRVLSQWPIVPNMMN